MRRQEFKFRKRYNDVVEHAKVCNNVRFVEWDCGCSFSCSGDGCDCNRQCPVCGKLLRRDAIDEYMKQRGVS